MTLLDLLLVVSAASFALSGYRQGFLVGVLGFTGFLGGCLAGMALAPRIVGSWDSGPRQAVTAVAIVVLAAGLGQALLGLLGSMLRHRLTWRPARLLDAGFGATAGVVAVLVVAWAIASALRQAPFPAVARAIGNSHVLAAVDTVMPQRSAGVVDAFEDLLDERGFPQVFGGLSPERISPVEPPEGSLAAAPGVRSAARSIVEVIGAARACRRQVEGSGFVYAPERVLTNAHVVAGVDAPVLRVGGTGRSYAARVVVYDPRRDLAVLAVPGLDAPALRFDAEVERADEAVVAGFPRGGPYRVVPARVREELTARGADIYDSGRVNRRILSLYTDIEPGNSGGPLLSPAGRVHGVVFAKSLDDEHTGYALTVGETRPVANAGLRATEAVDTQACAA
ncbi:MAG: MarP family serine protease [Actinomycetota bacterium]|nr:MarP family serine protease [Actinomycetota bacterium]